MLNEKRCLRCNHPHAVHLGCCDHRGDEVHPDCCHSSEGDCARTSFVADASDWISCGEPIFLPDDETREAVAVGTLPPELIERFVWSNVGGERGAA